MSTIRIACAALTRRIYAGRVNKAGTAFLDGKVDATSDCLRAVIEHIGEGETKQVHVAGLPTFEISVRRLQAGDSTNTGETA